MVALPKKFKLLLCHVSFGAIDFPCPFGIEGLTLVPIKWIVRVVRIN